MLLRWLPLVWMVLALGCRNCPDLPVADDDDDATVGDDDDTTAGDDDDTGADDDDHAGDDDDVTAISLPEGVTAMFMQYDGEVEGQEYYHEALFVEDQLPLCGPQAPTGVTRFMLISDESVAATLGGVGVRADGYDHDAPNPEQTLAAPVDGGQYAFSIPDKPDRPFTWIGGTCYLFVRTQNCDLAYCGFVICGTLLEPVTNADGDWLQVYGEFQCMA